MILRVTDDSTADDLREAITHLRAKQRAAVIPSTAAEYGAAVDELLDMLTSRIEEAPC